MKETGFFDSASLDGRLVRLETSCDCSDHAPGRGSGTLLTPRHVLTVRHVVRSRPCRSHLRAFLRRPGGADDDWKDCTGDPQPCWEGTATEGLDDRSDTLVVVELLDPPGWTQHFLPLRLDFGRGICPVAVGGFPEWYQRWFHDQPVTGLWGTRQLGEGRFVRVDGITEPANAARRETWGGLSGGPVFSADGLCGVVTQAPEMLEGSFQAFPLEPYASEPELLELLRTGLESFGGYMQRVRVRMEIEPEILRAFARELSVPDDPNSIAERCCFLSPARIAEAVQSVFLSQVPRGGGRRAAAAKRALPFLGVLLARETDARRLRHGEGGASPTTRERIAVEGAFAEIESLLELESMVAGLCGHDAKYDLTDVNDIPRGRGRVLPAKEVPPSAAFDSDGYENRPSWDGIERQDLLLSISRAVHHPTRDPDDLRGRLQSLSHPDDPSGPVQFYVERHVEGSWSAIETTLRELFSDDDGRELVWRIRHRLKTTRDRRFEECIRRLIGTALGEE